MQVGDTIKCNNIDDMIDLMQSLIKDGIETDFLFEKEGEKGLWLIITEVK